MSRERSESTLLGLLQSLRCFDLSDDQRRALETAISYIADLCNEQVRPQVVRVPRREPASGSSPPVDPRQAALRFRARDDDGVPY